MVIRKIVFAAIISALVVITDCCLDNAGAESPTLVPITRLPAQRLPQPPLSELAVEMPDGGDIVDLYKAAETVTSIQDANRAVEAEIDKASSIVSGISALHSALIASCENQVDLASINVIGAKTKSLGTTVARVEREVMRSLTIMRKAVAGGSMASQRTKDAVEQYVIAAHTLGQLRVQAQEIDKTTNGLAVSIRRTATENCDPPMIPRLFARGVTSQANASLGWADVPKSAPLSNH
jgi:hypothetical protein